MCGLLAVGSVMTSTSADLGRKASRTPYDPYLGRVFSTLSGADSERPSVEYAAEKLRQARRMRHHYNSNRPYVPQSAQVTERTGVGDCKDKALWLAKELNDGKARFVVGKYRGSSRNHAWVMWSDGRSWWVLDPSFQSRPVRSDGPGGGAWKPQYSYDKNGRYVH